MAQAPTAITSFGAGMASYVFVTPDACSASPAGDQHAVGMAWRGHKLNPETAQIKDHRRKHVRVRFARVAAPALTSRNFSERPKIQRVCRSRASARRIVFSSTIRSSRLRTAIWKSGATRIAPSGQAFWQSAQKRQRPRSIRNGGGRHRWLELGRPPRTAGIPADTLTAFNPWRPRNRSGNTGSKSGYSIVRCPCCSAYECLQHGGIVQSR